MRAAWICLLLVGCTSSPRPREPAPPRATAPAAPAPSPSPAPAAMATVSEVLRARLAALPAGGAVEVMVWFDPARPRDQVGAELARVVGVVRDVVPSVPALVATATAAQVDVLARLDFVGRIDLYEADGEDD